MSRRFSSQTGLPVVDLFYNFFAIASDLQQKALWGHPFNIGLARQQQNGETAIGATEEQIIPITKEELRIGKREVQNAKAYRVTATTVEVPVEQQVSLRAETVVIERRPTKGTSVHGGQSFNDHTIEVHEMYEEPVIGKVVTQAEEVVIYKTLSERTATVRETLRETRVNVEHPPAKNHGHPQRAVDSNGKIGASSDRTRQSAVIQDQAKRPRKNGEAKRHRRNTHA